MGEIAAYLGEWVERRAVDPGSDLLSRIVTASVDGRPITRSEAFNVCLLMLLGGLDTVASMLGFVARFLAGSADQRRQLCERIDDQPFLRSAVEELVRRHGVVNTGRFIVEDMEYHGVQLRAGDLIQLPNSLVGLDERAVDDPLTVDFTRPFPIRHAAFGTGPHTCPGAVLARREIQIFIEEWLSRIPDFARSRAGMATTCVRASMPST